MKLTKNVNRINVPSHEIGVELMMYRKSVVILLLTISGLAIVGLCIVFIMPLFSVFHDSCDGTRCKISSVASTLGEQQAILQRLIGEKNNYDLCYEKGIDNVRVGGVGRVEESCRIVFEYPELNMKITSTPEISVNGVVWKNTLFPENLELLIKLTYVSKQFREYFLDNPQELEEIKCRQSEEI